MRICLIIILVIQGVYYIPHVKISRKKRITFFHLFLFVLVFILLNMDYLRICFQLLLLSYFRNVSLYAYPVFEITGSKSW